MTTDLYIRCDTYSGPSRRLPRWEYARDEEGRWWFRRFDVITIPKYPFTVVGQLHPWTLMGDIQPVTSESAPNNAVKHPRQKARLPINHLAKLGLRT